MQASAAEPDEEPDDEDADPEDEPELLPDEELDVAPEEEPDADPDEDPPELVGPELELLEHPAASVAAEAPMPTTTITWNSFFVVLKASPR